MTLHETSCDMSRDPGQSLADVEREHILQTLALCQGNRTRAAKILKISVRGLRMKLQNYAMSGREVTPSRQGEADGVRDVTGLVSSSFSPGFLLASLSLPSILRVIELAA